MTAPFAAEIAAVRTDEARARRAAVGLGLLAGVDPSEELGAARVAEVARDWPRIPPDPTSLRAALTPLAALLPALQARLEALRRAQHEALHAPEWAGLVEQVTSIVAERDAAAPAAARAAARAGHLAAAAEGAKRHATMLAQAAPPDVRAAVHAAWWEAMTPLLRGAGMAADVSRLAAADVDHAAAELSAAAAAAQAESTRLLERVASLDARVSEVLG